MKRRSAKAMSSLLLLVLLFLLFSVLFLSPVSALAAAPEISAEAAYLYCLEEEQAVFTKNETQVLYPASTVKIMTGLLAAEALAGRLDESVTIEKAMLGPGSGYRCLKLKTGDVLTVRDLLYGAICGNDYDACYALAYLVSGNTDVFVGKMNERASALGAAGTRYTNPTGVHDPAMTTTAADTAKVARAAWGNPLYLEISSADKYTTTGGVRISNRNSLVTSSPYRDERCKGLNTGMTDEGGYCIATVATDGKYTYLCVLLNADKENSQYTQVRSLFDWVFEAYGDVQLIAEGTKVGSVAVRLSEAAKTVDLYTAGSVSGYFPTDILTSPDFLTRCNLESDGIAAPVVAGQTVGTLSIMYQGKVLATIPVVAKEDVPKSGFLSAMESLKMLTSKRWLRIAIITAILLSALYALLVFTYRHSKRFRRRFQSDAYTNMTRSAEKERTVHGNQAIPRPRRPAGNRLQENRSGSTATQKIRPENRPTGTHREVNPSERRVTTQQTARLPGGRAAAQQTVRPDERHTAVPSATRSEPGKNRPGNSNPPHLQRNASTPASGKRLKRQADRSGTSRQADPQRNKYSR